jgi:hypothetical protein
MLLTPPEAIVGAVSRWGRYPPRANLSQACSSRWKRLMRRARVISVNNRMTVLSAGVMSCAFGLRATLTVFAGGCVVVAYFFLGSLLGL